MALPTARSLLGYLARSLQGSMPVTELVQILVENDSLVKEVQDDPALNLKFSSQMLLLSMKFPEVLVYGLAKGMFPGRKVSLKPVGKFLPVLVGDGKVPIALAPGLVKVIQLLLLFGLFTVTLASQVLPNTEVQVENGHLLVSSRVPTTAIVEITERFPTNQMDTFQEYLDMILDKVEGFTKFNPMHQRCAKIHKKASQADDLTTVVALANTLKLNNIVLSHYESDNNDHFVIVLKLVDKSTYECQIGFSVSQAQLFLSNNVWRAPPYYKHEMSSYRQRLVDSFKSDDKACLKAGIMVDSVTGVYAYNESIQISEPGIEVCSRICQVRNIQAKYAKKVNHLTAANITKPGCDAYTYSIGNRTCFLRNSLSENGLQNLDVYGTYNNLALTGDSSCHLAIDQGYPKLRSDGALIDARHLCVFSKENLAFQRANYRCMGLYQILHKPLFKVKVDLDLYAQNFGETYKLPNRLKRSVILLLSTIIQQLFKAAVHNGISNLAAVSERVQPLDLLSLLYNKLRVNGFKGQLVSNRKLHALQSSNLSSVITGSLAFEKLMNVDLTTDYNLVTTEIFQEFALLRAHFNSLMVNSLPLNNDTKDFIGDQPYVFSSYYDTNTKEIVRHFIMAKIEKVYSNKFMSYVPLTKNRFFNNLFWRTGLILGSQNSNNRCLVKLLHQDDEKVVLDNCRGYEIMQQNLAPNAYLLPHTFGRFDGYLFVLNKRGIIEISCSLGDLMFQCKGLCVAAISVGCRILVNSQSVLSEKKEKFGFEPKIIVSLDHSINSDEFSSFAQYNEELQYALFVLLLCFILTGCGVQKCRRGGCSTVEDKELETVHEESELGQMLESVN